MDEEEAKRGANAASEMVLRAARLFRNISGPLAPSFVDGK